jgi:hypothetical protein
MNNEELVKEVCPIFSSTGWAHYFVPETQAKGAEFGLDGLQFYVIGRGGPLGDCEGSAVASAFGYFKPSLIATAWDAARAKVAPRTAGKAHLECCANLGRAKLSEVPHLAEFVHAADAVNDASDTDGLTLYAAVKAEPLVTDIPGRAMQLVTILREFRGSAHLVAIRAVGLDSKTAHFVKRPADIKMFGWNASDAPEIDQAVNQKMSEAESLTDRLVAPAYSVLDDAGRANLLAGALAIKSALGR